MDSVRFEEGPIFILKGHSSVMFFLIFDVSDDLFTVRFDKTISMEQEDLAVCLSHGVVSQALFFDAFDKSLKHLQEHEQLPTIEK